MVPAGTVLSGMKYRLRAYIRRNAQDQGYTEDGFSTNLPPYGGQCSIHPERGNTQHAVREQAKYIYVSIARIPTNEKGGKLMLINTGRSGDTKLPCGYTLPPPSECLHLYCVLLVYSVRVVTSCDW